MRLDYIKAAIVAGQSLHQLVYTGAAGLLALYRTTCQTHTTERRAEKMSWRMLNPIRARAGEREKEKVRPGRI